MNKTDEFLKNLKTEFEMIAVPELKDNIKRRYSEQTNHHNRVSLVSYLKPLKAALMSSISFVIVILGIIIITTERINHPIEQNPKPIITGEKNIFTFQALSSVSLFSISPNNDLSSLDFNIKKDDNNNDDKDKEEERNDEKDDDNVNYEFEIDKIHDYIFMIDQVLTYNIKLTVDTINSPYEKFQYQDNIEIITAFDKTINYVFHYNFLQENDEKEKYILEGILLFNDLEFKLNGICKQEKNETKISLNAYFDDENWVEVEQKIENNEEKYIYNISNNGVFSKTAIKLSLEKNNEINIKMSFIDEDSNIEYMIIKETDQNENKIIIRRIENNSSLIIHVRSIIENDTVKYEYKFIESGNTINKEDRNNKKNGNNPINHTLLFVY